MTRANLSRYVANCVPVGLVLCGCASSPAQTSQAPRTPPTAAAAASTPSAYPSIAPIAQYREADAAGEAALARSAAPSSVADRADVMVLGEHGYTVAQKGSNGFVCVVERAWANDFDDPQFWNPKVRAPICFNHASARSVLPAYLERTEWVLAGVPVADMIARTKTAIASNHFGPPEAGSMCFMMSRLGYLSDADGHWHPHVMFFTPRMETGDVGANLPGSPLFAFSQQLPPVTIVLSPAAKWSDGTPDTHEM